ncbi:MAG: DUF1592 domain-containing protein [bacterium]|nr:DUF1592 domain-containing protein [bacterium]
MHRRAIHFAITCLAALSSVAVGQSESNPPTFAELKAAGAQASRYRGQERAPAGFAAPRADLATFREQIEPILKANCYRCHGAKKAKADLRVDTLDPDLFAGDDVDWWLEVQAVLTNGEMPPEDDAAMPEDHRTKVIDWLAGETLAASVARRGSAEHSSFRRMARYEYRHAMQDLLGLPFDFAADLPPDPVSEDGFENSSETLHVSGMQLRTYLDSARKALRLATVRGDQPAPLYWSVSMKDVAAREWRHQDQQLAKLEKKHAKNPKKLAAEVERHRAGRLERPGGVFYRDLESGRMARQRWGYNGAKFAWAPVTDQPAVPPLSGHVAVLPPRRHLFVELGDRLPERGELRVRVRAWRADASAANAPSLRLMFGWKASNDSQANVRLDAPDHVVEAIAGAPRFYEWRVPLSQVYPRNLVRGINKLGDLPSPSEYLRIVNASLTGGDVVLDHVAVAAPVYESWPPASHARIFFPSENRADEPIYVREVIGRFLTRAWRREPTVGEVDRKVRLFERLRPRCDTLEDAVLETLAAALASPNFLYLVELDAASAGAGRSELLTEHEFASRLAMFLWCGLPDEELLDLAVTGRLGDPEVLVAQVDRMLADPRSQRFCEHFVRQWLNLELLDFLHVDKKVHPRFDAELKRSMRREPVAFFAELLRENFSVLEFLHADFAMLDERLARHYGIKNVFGNHLRRVDLDTSRRRGGLLTQAGLLAMNSDGKDSHPLKRGVWMLERILDDPPPPPPPAVPEIDLTDPRIAKMTLKERIEDHRNHAACRSCHAKIDPWGIAFENFDAVGSWRSEIQGKPVDAASTLFNGQRLDGMAGLKRFLLLNRQDQFVRALVRKLATYALGRPLGFGDRAAIEAITRRTRRQGDGLAAMVKTLANSQLFRAK